MKKIMLVCLAIGTLFLTSFTKKKVNSGDIIDTAAYDTGVLLGFNDAVYHLQNAGEFMCIWQLQKADDVTPDIDPAIHPQVDPFHLNRWIVNSCAYYSFTFWGGVPSSGFINFRNSSHTGLDAAIADPNTSLYYRSRYLGQKVGIDLAYGQAMTAGQGSFIPPF